MSGTAASGKAGGEVRGRLQRLGVLRESGHEHPRGSLVIPILGARVGDADGEVLNLYGRKIRDDLRAGTSDHLYLPGPHRGVFNLAALAASEELILTEALIDDIRGVAHDPINNVWKGLTPPPPPKPPSP